MIRRIVLENYMSHSRTVVEPAAGLTVLVGPNNCGKSAVLSAIQSVCGETVSDYMIRHGEKAARVTIETDDGHTIVWNRKEGGAHYTIDGVDVHRVGRGRDGLPDNLHALLRMPLIESPSGRRFQVHFGSQKDPIFLLGNEAELAAFFSSSAESERLMEMQRRHKTKVNRRRGEQRAIEADLSRLNTQLSALEPLEDLIPHFRTAETAHRDLVQAGQRADQLADRIDRLDRLHRQADRLSAELSAAADLAPPPPQSDLQPLTSSIAAIDRADGDFRRWTAVAAALRPLQDAPQVHDTRPLETLGRALRQAIEGHARAAAVATALEPLGDVPKLDDLTPLQTTVLHLEKSTTALAAATRDVATADQAVATVEAEIVRFVTQHPLCPTCGGPLTASRLMHGGAGHVQT